MTTRTYLGSDGESTQEFKLQIATSNSERLCEQASNESRKPQYQKEAHLLDLGVWVIEPSLEPVRLSLRAGFGCWNLEFFLYMAFLK